MMLMSKSSAALCVVLCGLTAWTCGQESPPRRRPAAVAPAAGPLPPAVGKTAPDLELKGVDGTSFSLKSTVSGHPVVVVVLRGWPGYQCPLCTRQVGEFIERGAAFREHGAEVVFVYPGPADLLERHAREFQGARELPPHFRFVLDPDYKFTSAWGLRWDAPRETAYPSTFIVGRDGRIRFGMTSSTHGGRVAAATVLQELSKLK